MVSYGNYWAQAGKIFIWVTRELKVPPLYLDLGDKNFKIQIL